MFLSKVTCGAFRLYVLAHNINLIQLQDYLQYKLEKNVNSYNSIWKTGVSNIKNIK